MKEPLNKHEIHNTQLACNVLNLILNADYLSWIVLRCSLRATEIATIDDCLIKPKRPKFSLKEIQ